MIGELRASLYDLFGYLIPGAVLAAALYLLVVIPGGSQVPLDLVVLQYREAVASALLMSYLAGHLAHALGNQLPWLAWSPEESILGGRLMLGTAQGQGVRSSIVEQALYHIRLRYGVDPGQLSPRECYALMDESRVLLEREGDREIFVYREGFYRAMTVVAGMLTISLATRAFFAPLCFHWKDYSSCIASPQLWIMVCLSAASVPGFAARLRRFGRYRVETAMLRWLALNISSGPSTSSRNREAPQ